MNRLALCALQESYSVQLGCSAERIAISGGHDRYVKSTNTKKHLVQISFVLNEDDYLYFRAFYQNWQLNPLPFLMKLVIEDEDYKDYIVQFVQNSCRFDELNGKVFKVSAQLTVFISPTIAITSKPYPLYFIEKVAVDLSVEDSASRPDPVLVSVKIPAVENIGAELTLHDVVLSRPPKTELTENIGVQLTVHDVVARQMLKYSMQENLSVSLAMHDVASKPRIKTSIDEAINVSLLINDVIREKI